MTRAARWRGAAVVVIVMALWLFATAAWRRPAVPQPFAPAAEKARSTVPPAAATASALQLADARAQPHAPAASAKTPPPSASSPTLPLTRRRLVYVYPWPKHCHDVGLCDAPTPEASRRVLCQEMNTSRGEAQSERLAACASHLGLGEAMASFSDARTAAYATHQFAAGSLFQRRLYASAWRTQDPAQATVFFIPYESVFPPESKRAARLTCGRMTAKRPVLTLTV